MALSDTELMEDISKGGKRGKAAFSVFYERYASNIKAFLINFTNIPGADVSDIFQDTCVKIVHSAHTYKGGSLAGWVKTIARNTAYDYSRKYGGFVGFEDGEAEALIDENACTSDHDSVDDCVQLGLAKFRDSFPQRYVAIQAQVEGMSIVEISELLDRSLSATKEFISQSKKKLSPFLRPCTELLRN